MTTIPIRVVQTILDEIESVYDDVTKRAYEKFLSRRGTCTLDIEEWLEAERELLLKPPVQLIEKDGQFIVRLELAKVDPNDLKILLTPDDAIVQSLGRYPNRRIFRTIHFPWPVDTSQVRAWLFRGRLILVVLKESTNFAKLRRGKQPLESRTLSINKVV